MNDPGDPDRDAIHEVLQTHSAAAREEGTVLTGWVVVTEWIDSEGNRFLGKMRSPGLTAWGAGGFHHEALYGDWPTE